MATRMPSNFLPDMILPSFSSIATHDKAIDRLHLVHGRVEDFVTQHEGKMVVAELFERHLQRLWPGAAQGPEQQGSNNDEDTNDGYGKLEQEAKDRQKQSYSGYKRPDCGSVASCGRSSVQEFLGTSLRKGCELGLMTQLLCNSGVQGTGVKRLGDIGVGDSDQRRRGVPALTGLRRGLILPAQDDDGQGGEMGMSIDGCQ